MVFRDFCKHGPYYKVKWTFFGSERTWWKMRNYSWLINKHKKKKKQFLKTKNKHFLHKQYIHVPSCNPKLLKESCFTCMGRKWQRYLNIHFSWEIISRKYATGAWGQGTDHPPQSPTPKYLDKTKNKKWGGSNSTNTHIYIS